MKTLVPFFRLTLISLWVPALPWAFFFYFDKLFGVSAEPLFPFFFIHINKASLLTVRGFYNSTGLRLLFFYVK